MTKTTDINTSAGDAETRPSEVVAQCDGSADVPDFRSELGFLINRHNKESGSNTPDFVLRDYLCACLCAFDVATQQREKWHGRKPKPAHIRYGIEMPNIMNASPHRTPKAGTTNED